ncbi:hypothetical protein BU15DRAFT_77927 [Melanogaster broomeanus]|nr:hypothetical protein BU15DRAFT_77927 [Melanogaster broomeanus]
MSSTSKSITPAPAMSGIDWTRFKTPELESDVEDNDEIALAKAKERRRRKVEKKHREDEERRLQEEAEKRRREEEEQRRREEAERRRRDEEEAELRKRGEEQREHEETQRKAAEAPTRRDRGRRLGPGQRCPRVRDVVTVFAAPGLESRAKFTNDGNKRRTACDRCAAQEGEVRMARDARARDRKREGQGQRSPNVASVKARRRNEYARTKAQDDDEVEIVGESRSGAGPSRAHRESTEAQRESSRVSRRVARALEDLVDEAACFGAPEEFIDESSGGEEADEEELREDLAGLEKELAESPMSPPRKQVT